MAHADPQRPLPGRHRLVGLGLVVAAPFHDDLVEDVHHLPAPGDGDGKEGNIDVLDEVHPASVFHAGKTRARLEPHDIAIARVAGEIEGPVEVSGIGKAEAGSSSAGKDHRPGPANDQVPGPHVDPHSPGHSSVIQEKPKPHGAVDHEGPLLLGLPGDDYFQVQAPPWR